MGLSRWQKSNEKTSKPPMASLQALARLETVTLVERMGGVACWNATMDENRVRFANGMNLSRRNKFLYNLQQRLKLLQILLGELCLNVKKHSSASVSALTGNYWFLCRSTLPCHYGQLLGSQFLVQLFQILFSRITTTFSTDA